MRNTGIMRVYTQQRGPGEEIVAVCDDVAVVKYANGEARDITRGDAARLILGMRDAGQRHPVWAGRIKFQTIRPGQ